MSELVEGQISFLSGILDQPETEAGELLSEQSTTGGFFERGSNLVQVDCVKLLETKAFFISKSSEISIKWMCYLTQIFGMKWHWEQVLLSILAVVGGQGAGCELLGFAVLTTKV